MNLSSRHSRKRKERQFTCKEARCTAEDDNLAALITAVDRLNAGTQSHCSNRDARAANRSHRRNDLDLSTCRQQDSTGLLREQLGALQEEKHRLEVQVNAPGRPDGIPFTGDMEQLLSRLQEITQREAQVMATLQASGASGGPAFGTDGYAVPGHQAASSAAALRQDLEAAREDERELADLREQKLALEERLARLAVCWSPCGSPVEQQGKRRCRSALARVHEWLRESGDDPPAASLGGARGWGKDGEGRQEVLLKARAALQATDNCLGCKWDDWKRPSSSSQPDAALSDGDHSMCVQLDTSEF